MVLPIVMMSSTVNQGIPSDVYCPLIVLIGHRNTGEVRPSTLYRAHEVYLVPLKIKGNMQSTSESSKVSGYGPNPTCLGILKSGTLLHDVVKLSFWIPVPVEH